MNEQGNCHPGGDCPDGYGRVDDDTIECDNGAIVLDEDDCAIYDPPVAPQEEGCEAGFVLENGKCAALDSNCGGVPCTSSDKEDSTTTDPVPAEPEPEPETTDSEETVEEIEETETEEEPEEEQ